MVVTSVHQLVCWQNLVKNVLKIHQFQEAAIAGAAVGAAITGLSSNR